MPIANPYESMDVGMFGKTQHSTKRLIRAANAACILRLELAAPPPIFKAANQVAVFLKNSGAVMTKTTRLADLRANPARGAQGGLMKLVKECLYSAFASKRAGGDGSGDMCETFEATATMEPETVLKWEQGAP